MEKGLPIVWSSGSTIKDRTQRLAASFLNSLSEESKIAYESDLKDFAELAGTEDTEEVSRWLVSQLHGDANYTVLSYQNDLRSKGLAIATVDRRMTAIRSLVNFANTIELISWKLDIGNIRHETYKNVSGIAAETFELILEAAKSQDESIKAVRDFAILLLMHDLGLRRKEVIGPGYPPDLAVAAPHAPNLNLIERLWKFFKAQVLANRYYKKFDEFRHASFSFFRALRQHKAKLCALLTDKFHIVDPLFE